MVRYEDFNLNEHLEHINIIKEAMKPLVEFNIGSAIQSSVLAAASRISESMSSIALHDSHIDNMMKAIEPVAETLKNYRLEEAMLSKLATQASQLTEAYNSNMQNQMNELSQVLNGYMDRSYYSNVVSNIPKVSEAITIIEPYYDDSYVNLNDSGENETLSQEEVNEIQDALSCVFRFTDSGMTIFREKVALLPPKLICLLRWLFFFVVLPFLIGVASNYWYEAKTNSKVRQEPNISSSSVYSLTVNQKFIVVNNTTSYYYEIQFVDPETDELITGFIPKRNAVPIQDENNSDKDNDNPEESE